MPCLGIPLGWAWAGVTGTAPDDVLREAARACPAGAIVLIDEETGEEVDPG